MYENSAMDNQNKKLVTINAVSCRASYTCEKSARDDFVNNVNIHLCDGEVSETKDVCGQQLDVLDTTNTRLIDSTNKPLRLASCSDLDDVMRQLGNVSCMPVLVYELLRYLFTH